MVLVTPEFVGSLDPQEVPPCGPGQLTTTPGDVDLYWRGYLEAPRCCDDGNCSSCRGGMGPTGELPGGTYPEVIPAYEESGPGAPPAVQDGGPGVSTSVDDILLQMPSYHGASRTTGPAYDDGGEEPTLIGPVGYDVPK